MVETDGGSRDRRGLVTTKGFGAHCVLAWLTPADQIVSWLIKQKQILQEKALTFSKLLQHFNTRKLTRDEGDQNLRGWDYLRGPQHVACLVNMTGVMKTNDTTHQPWLQRRGVWFISRAGWEGIQSEHIVHICIPEFIGHNCSPVSLLCCIGVDLCTVFGPSCDRDHLELGRVLYWEQSHK